jgi:hypothetical protein
MFTNPLSLLLSLFSARVCPMQVRDVCFTLHKQQHLVGILHEVDCLPSYYMAGGLVFAPLSLPCMEAVYGSRWAGES